MSALNVEDFGNVTVIECERRIVQSEAAYRLRNAVIAQAEIHADGSSHAVLAAELRGLGRWLRVLILA